MNIALCKACIGASTHPWLVDTNDTDFCLVIAADSMSLPCEIASQHQFEDEPSVGNVGFADAGTFDSQL